MVRRAPAGPAAAATGARPRREQRLWADLVDEGVARGAFRCVHPRDARRAVIAACNAIAQWYEPHGGLDVGDLVERYTAIALRIVDHR